MSVVKKKNWRALSAFMNENSTVGTVHIKAVVPAVFKTIEEYKKFMHEFCINHAIKAVKKGIGIDDQISIYVNFLDVIDELINSWFERIFELFTIYYPEASLKAQELDSFLEIENFDIKSLSELFNISKENMGMDFEDKDIVNLKSGYETLKLLVKQKKEFSNRIGELVSKRAPNTSKLAGELVTARLMSLAGGLRRLSLFPSSTIQVLGAEKALFRHLKAKGRGRNARPPKHGVIFQSMFVSGAPRKHRGKMARALASKIAISSKVDYYKGESIWEKLVKSLEAKRDGLK